MTKFVSRIDTTILFILLRLFLDLDPIMIKAERAGVVVVVRGGEPKMFLHISSSYFEIRLHTNFELLPVSGPTVLGSGWWVVLSFDQAERSILH